MKPDIRYRGEGACCLQVTDVTFVAPAKVAVDGVMSEL